MSERPRKTKRPTAKRKPGASVSRKAPGAKRRPVQNKHARFGWFWRFLMHAVWFGTLAVAACMLYFIVQLPDIKELDSIRKQQGITMLTQDGRTIANYGDVYGQYVPYEKLPKELVEAVIATEDRRFFAHFGIDLVGITRAMVKNIIAGRIVEGGSTITQQVAKNVFLTPERSLERKIEEMLLAFWLEARFSKQEIMAIYLNRVYLGAGTYGVDAAARRYFYKSATELNLAESALMAGLLKAPSRYSPTSDVTRAKKRIRQVLLNMVDAGYLERDKIEPAIASFEESPAREADGGAIRYFTDWIRDEIPNYVGNVDEDLVVYTTLATSLQKEAADALENVLANDGEQMKASQGAVVAMTPDGAVKALVGGVNYNKSQYNRAMQAKRQPGSSFKMFVYLAALEAGYSPQGYVLDAPITIRAGNKLWSPGNYTGSFKGQVTLADALKLSLNTAAVRVSQAVGANAVAAMAMRLGVTDVMPVPSIALGSDEATLLEMVSAYAHMPNHGLQVSPYGILMIKNKRDEVLYERNLDAKAPRVLEARVVEQMSYMLSQVVSSGTGTRARLPKHEVAGKTGTSQDYKDAWFIGYTNDLVTGVWVGNDNNAKMAHVTGGSLPATIWHDFMVRAMEAIPASSLPKSAGAPAGSGGLLPWLFGGQKVLMGEDASAETPATGSRSGDSANDSGLLWGDMVPNREELEYTYPKTRER